MFKIFGQPRHGLNTCRASEIRRNWLHIPANLPKPCVKNQDLHPGGGVVWENGVRLPDKGFLKAQRKRREQDPRVVFGFVGGPSQIKGWPVIRAAFAGISSADFRVLLVDGSV